MQELRSTADIRQNIQKFKPADEEQSSSLNIR